jgi:hypothetical protein
VMALLAYHLRVSTGGDLKGAISAKG